VGSGFMYALSNGNYLVTSPYWSNGSAASAGAMTFGSGTSGAQGAVSAANSLVGLISDTGLRAFPTIDNVNSNYFAVFPHEDSGRVRVASQVDGQSGPVATVTIVTSSECTSVFGQAVTLTATVTSVGSATATGTVTFFLDGSTPLGTST